ncbi:MAG: class I SAM-dependent methyltransferase [Theionarchaea archaeon]|nr:class I SAM-dependent methyltransferase [Theionarchaea archaeon]MBU7000862.1 class I SAM-dependent methyltransferase [Theionarchaea archaeon]MBU7035936.1 class I SAM-dependent methyltransferase [Theionarchaea archaeon]MBU7040356.1 class I SAM-dependent methyltransferase [Theionarchaea archaeon]
MKMTSLERIFMNQEHHKKHIIHRFERLILFVKKEEDLSFLEVGCGSGAVSLYCAQNYPFKVTGVDIDPRQVESARSYASKTGVEVMFLESDATNLPFEDESHDIVLSFGVTHHIRNWLDALKEIERVLKVDGYFIYWDLMYPGPLAAIGRFLSSTYGITTVKEFNSFLERSTLCDVHKTVKTSPVFGEVEGVFRKKNE